jgi:phosphatidylglycerol lysyltransferase
MTMIHSWLIHYGYVLLFFGVAVEADAFLIAGAFLAHRGYFDIRAVVGIAILATSVANQGWFWLARRRGREFLQRRLQTDRRLRRVHSWLERRGAILIPASRFLYGFRVAIPVAYGASGSAPLTFTILDAASAVVWGFVVGFAGYAFGDTMEFIVADVQRYESAILAAVLLAAAVLMFRHRDRGAAVLALVRRPVEAGSDAALQVFILVRRASRLLVAHPNGRLALVAVLLGALNVLTAVVGTRIVHVERLAAWLPFEVTHGSRALILLAGLALMYLGRAIARRKRLAWVLATGLAAGSAILYLADHGSVVRATLSAAFAAELWRQRHRFHARTDPMRLRHAILATPALAIAVSLYGLAGLREFGHPAPRLADALRATWRIAGFQDPPIVATTRSTMAWAWSLRFLLVASSGYVLMAAFAPVAWREYRSRIEGFKVAGLAWQYGEDSLSYFAKQADKRHFTADGRAFIGFRVRNRVAVAAGDPVGEPDAIPELVARFVDHCRVNDWVPVFYEASSRYLEAYRGCGLRWFKVGEEAVLDLPTWSMSGGAVAKVRQFVNKIRREAPDLRVSEYRRRVPNPDLDDQLEDISSEWLAGKKGGEMGFNLAVFSVDQLGDKRTFIARRADGTVEAFVTWLPYRAGRAAVLDAMRYRQTAPPGVMDLLIAESALAFKQEGLEALSLAVAPLANADEGTAASPYDRAVRLIFEHFSQVYGYRSLFQFKKKFAPRWEPRHLVFPRPDLLPRIAYAVVGVHYSRTPV